MRPKQASSASPATFAAEELQRLRRKRSRSSARRGTMLARTRGHRCWRRTSCALRTAASRWSCFARSARAGARLGADTRYAGRARRWLRTDARASAAAGASRLTFIDPPYEETRHDFDRVTSSVTEALRRFESGVVCAWYPIKDDRDVTAWKRSFTGRCSAKCCSASCGSTRRIPASGSMDRDSRS